MWPGSLNIAVLYGAIIIELDIFKNRLKQGKGSE